MNEDEEFKFKIEQPKADIASKTSSHESKYFYFTPSMPITYSVPKNHSAEREEG